MLRPKEGIDPRFVVGVIHAPGFVQHAVSGTTGVQHPRTSWRHVRDFELPAFTSREQETVASISSSIDRKADLSRKKSAVVDGLLRFSSLFDYAVHDAGPSGVAAERAPARAPRPKQLACAPADRRRAATPPPRPSSASRPAAVRASPPRPRTTAYDVGELVGRLVQEGLDRHDPGRPPRGRRTGSRAADKQTSAPKVDADSERVGASAAKRPEPRAQAGAPAPKDQASPDAAPTKGEAPRCRPRHPGGGQAGGVGA